MIPRSGVTRSAAEIIDTVARDIGSAEMAGDIGNPGERQGTTKPVGLSDGPIGQKASVTVSANADLTVVNDAGVDQMINSGDHILVRSVCPITDRQLDKFLSVTRAAAQDWEPGLRNQGRSALGVACFPPAAMANLPG